MRQPHTILIQQETSQLVFNAVGNVSDTLTSVVAPKLSNDKGHVKKRKAPKLSNDIHGI